MSKKKKRPELVPVSGPIIDSHAHVSTRTFGDEVDAVLERAFKSGLESLINIGAGYGTVGIEEVLAVSARDPRIHPTVGVHPHDARILEEDPSIYDRLKTWAQTPGVVAWGEVGLDFHYDNSSPDAQRAALREQIRLAKQVGLPLIVHDRDAHQEILDIFDEERAWSGGVLIHCFSGDLAFAKECTSRGALISMSGIVSYATATNLHEVAAKTPLEHLLVETDCPYLAPTPYRGKRNEPAYVHQVLREVARLRGEEPEAIAETIAENTRRFFGLS